MSNDIKIGNILIEKEVLRLTTAAQFLVMNPLVKDDWATKNLRTATTELLLAIANARKQNEKIATNDIMSRITSGITSGTATGSARK